MKILLFSGTADGKELSKRLADMGCEVTVSVVSGYGVESQGEYEGVSVISGAKDPDEIESMLPDFDVLIDATHPYASHIRETLKEAAKKTGTRRFRMKRGESDIPEGTEARFFDSVKEAAEMLSSENGNIMITTGAKELGEYSVIDSKRLFPRVLPLESSLKACEDAGIPAKDIIAMQGPFTVELNTALMKQFDISFLVTKESGREGGFDEKLRAAKAAGAELIVIKRPDDEGIGMEEIIDNIGKERATI